MNAGHQARISAVVTVHREGRLAHRTMRSLFRSVGYAREHGMSVETIVVMDSPDRATEEYFARYGEPDLHISRVSFHDPGLTRNHGVSVATGDYVALIDGDDLVSRDWLYRAVEYLQSHGPHVIAHPQFHHAFGEEMFLWCQVSSSSADCRLDDLLEFNHWGVVSVARKEIFVKYPFESAGGDSGFGWEDWHFNCETLADGIEHHVVPKTVYYWRLRSTGSRTALDRSSPRVIRPTKLFDPQAGLTVLSEDMRQKRRWLAVVKEHGNGSSRYRAVRRELFGQIQAVGRLVRARSPRVFTVIRNSWRRLSGLGRAAMAAMNASTGRPSPLPEWLTAEWREIHSIEPQLFPERWLTQTIPVRYVLHSGLGRPYVEMCRLYGDNVSHVFLVPWLKMGAADREALNYVDALVMYGLGNEIVVIATGADDSPWATRLPDGVRFIEFGKRYSYLAPKEQETLLTRVLLQTAPQAVHNVDSDLGYRLFVKYGTALRSVSHLYVSVFGKDVPREGSSAGYPLTYLPECIDSLTAVACDNQSFMDELRRLYAFDLAKIRVHHQPVEKAAVGEQGQGLVRFEHSWERFRDELREFPEYVLQR